MVGRLAALALLAMVVAGCAGNTPPSSDTVKLGDGTQIDLADVQASSTRGAISGVVVDEAIRPQGGVTVKVSPVTKAVTDAQGLFVIPDLDPGLYTLSANATGFLPIQTTAEVRAGEVAKVRMVLPTDKSPQPYHTTLKFDWYDEAGVTLVDFAVDLVGRSFLNGTLPPMCDRCFFYFSSDGPVDTFVIEAAWKDNIPDAAEGTTEYFWSVYDQDTAGEYEDDYFENPGRAEVTGTRFGNDTNFGIGMSADEDWVTYEQQAELFVTMFYLAPPPDGWSFIAGDT